MADGKNKSSLKVFEVKNELCDFYNKGILLL